MSAIIKYSHNVLSVPLQTKFDSVVKDFLYIEYDRKGNVTFNKQYFQFVLNKLNELKEDSELNMESGVAANSSGEIITLKNLISFINRWFDIVQNKYTRNSVIALNSDLSIYFGICENLSINPFFIRDIDAKKIISIHAVDRKAATISRFINSISKFLSGCTIHNPIQDELVKASVTKIKSSIGAEQWQATPLTIPMLDKIIAGWQTCTSIPKLRNMLVMTFLYECLMRRSELVNIQVSDLSELNGNYSLSVIRLKTDRTGKSKRNVPISHLAWNLCARYIQLAKITDGYLIRPLNRNNQPKDKQLSINSVNLIVKAISKELNLKNGKELSTHSGRVGGIQDLVINQFSIGSIQQNAGLKSAVMVSRYSRKIDSANMPMADLLRKRV